MEICCGVGLNLDNDKPVKGINALSGSKISREVLLARVFNLLETKINQLKDGSWRDEYYNILCHKEKYKELGMLELNGCSCRL